MLLGPDAREVEREGVEGLHLRDDVTSPRARRLPSTAHELEGFEHLRDGVDEPCERDAVLRVEGHLHVAVQGGGGGRQHPAHPVGRDRDGRGADDPRHAFAAPPGEVGLHLVRPRAEVELGLGQEVPPARAADAPAAAVQAPVVVYYEKDRNSRLLGRIEEILRAKNVMFTKLDVHNDESAMSFVRTQAKCDADQLPIVFVADVSNILVVHPSVPANTVEEFIVHLKRNPDALNYGSTGVGTATMMTSASPSMAGSNMRRATSSMRCSYSGELAQILALSAAEAVAATGERLTGFLSSTATMSRKLRAVWL